jgi:hypothetical protein
MSPEERLRSDYEESKRLTIVPALEPATTPAFKVDEELMRDMREPLPDELPDHVMVAGYKVLVEEDDDLLERQGLHGLWTDTPPWRIIISSELSIEEKWYIYYHELVHALHDLVGLRLMRGHIECPS